MQIKINETGRSMVEMLGVLAIIGVLSVAGVGTYQYALTAYQVGKIQDVLGKAKTLAQTDSRASHALEVNRFLKSALPEYTPDDKKSMVKLVDGNYQVTAFKVVYKVCEKLLQRESILNEMGISILTRMCGNPNSKTNMVFSFNATPTVESGSHFGGGSSGGNGGSGGLDMPDDNPSSEPQSCPDKMAWRQKDDGTYGCVCRHEYEFGDNCERCYPPKEWIDNICQCPRQTPIETAEGCVECQGYADCKDASKPYCDTKTSTCEPCPNGEKWNGKRCVLPCKTNEECNKNGRTGYYCYNALGYACSGYEFYGPREDKGECHFAEDDMKKVTVKWNKTDSKGLITYGTTNFYAVPELEMTWHSANRFCKSIGKRQVTTTDFQCADNVGSWGYCHKKYIGSNAWQDGNISTVVTKLKTALNGGWYWFSNIIDECSGYGIGLEYGNIDGEILEEGYYALCVDDAIIEGIEPEEQVLCLSHDDCTEIIGKNICKNGTCSSCETNDDCDMGLYCADTGLCSECLNNTHCIDETKPTCDLKMNVCVPCLDGTRWNGKECVEYCTTNADCNKDGKYGYYCYQKKGYACGIEFEGPFIDTGICRVAKDDAIQATINWTHYDGYGREVMGTKTFYGTPNLEMTWWSANRFCEAIGGRVAGSNDMHCMDGLGRWGYCHYKAIGSNAYVKDNISKIVTGLWEAFGKVGDDFYWLDKVYTSCEVYQVGLEFGNIDGTYTTNSYPALCVID